MTDFRIRLVTYPAAAFQIVKSLPGRGWLAVVEALVCLLAIGSCLGEGYYNGKWMAVSAAIVLVLCARIYDRFGLAAALMVGYALASGVWIMDYGNRYATVNPYDLLGIKMFAAQAMYKLVLVVLPLVLFKMDRPTLIRWGKGMAAAFIAISLCDTAWEWAWHGCAGVNSCGGALRNPSLNASMLVVLVPLVSPWLVLPVLASCLVSKTGIGAGMCAVYLSLLAWQRFKPLLLAVPAVIAASYYTHGGKALFDSSGRFPMWRFFMKLWAVKPKPGTFEWIRLRDGWWVSGHFDWVKLSELWHSLNWKNIICGTGFGTFGVFSTNLQTAFSMNPTDWWVWMHNDWLQMAFECGIMGLALMFWVYALCVRRLSLRGGAAPELQSLLLFGVMMGCQYGLHIAPCCAYAAWIAAVALMQVEKPTAILGYQHGIHDAVMGDVLLDKFGPQLGEPSHSPSLGFQLVDTGQA